MVILVTGGAGFIGSHTVVELYNAGHTAVIIDDFSNSDSSVLENIESIIGEKVVFYEGNCNDITILNTIFKENKIDGVIHFAAYKAVGESVANPLKYYTNNINSLLVLLESMQLNEVEKIVFSSSCTVYGEPDHIPVTEETPRKPAESPYGNTKVICEDILKDAATAKLPIQSISLRYFNPVGAHESAKIGELPKGVPSNLIPYVTQTAIGIREQLTVFGNDYGTNDGYNIRDFIHVVDLAKAHIAAFDYLSAVSEPFNDVFNVGTGEGTSVMEIINTFEKVNNLELNYKVGPRRPGDVEKIYGNVEKAKNLLNWQTEKSVEDSLKDAWNWEKALKNKK